MSIIRTKKETTPKNPNGGGSHMKIKIGGVHILSAMEFHEKRDGMRVCAIAPPINFEKLELGAKVEIEIEFWE